MCLPLVCGQYYDKLDFGDIKMVGLLNETCKFVIEFKLVRVLYPTLH